MPAIGERNSVTVGEIFAFNSSYLSSVRPCSEREPHAQDQLDKADEVDNNRMRWTSWTRSTRTARLTVADERGAFVIKACLILINVVFCMFVCLYYAQTNATYAQTNIIFIAQGH